MDIVRDTYEQLRRDYAMSEYDFSENWLKKSKGYFAYLKCTGSQPSLEAILALYGEAIKRTELFEQLEAQHNGMQKDLYRQRGHYFRDITHKVESKIRQMALAN